MLTVVLVEINSRAFGTNDTYNDAGNNESQTQAYSMVFRCFV
jgi:hypothetical protein